MIPFSSWVRGLIASCAKTHETNNFTQPQNIKNGVTIDSDSLSDGYKGYVKFTNNGDVAGVYGHVSATGTKSVILKAGSKKLGLGITDEGFPWTYCEHPVEGGDNHQIATYGYVEDQIDTLSETVNQLAETLNNFLSGFDAAMLSKINELKAYVDTQDTAIRALITALTARVNTLENVEGDDESTLMEAFNNRLISAVSSGFLWDIDNIGCLRLVLISEGSVDGAVHSIKTGTTIDPNDYYVFQAGLYFQLSDDDDQYSFPNGATDHTDDFSKYASSRITVGKWKVLSPYLSESGKSPKIYCSRLCLIVRVA